MSSSNQLTKEDRIQLATIGVYRVNLHTNEGWPGTFKSTEAFCLTYPEAAEVQGRLIKKNAGHDYRIAGPVYLLQLFDRGDISLEKTQSLLKRVQEGEKPEHLPPPLTYEEKIEAGKISVYYVWYEDRFHFGGDRDSYPVCICLTREEAETECQKYDRPVGPGTDGYFVEGPFKLSDERRPEIVRLVLENRAAKRTGPIMMNHH